MNAFLFLAILYKRYDIIDNICHFIIQSLPCKKEEKNKMIVSSALFAIENMDTKAITHIIPFLNKNSIEKCFFHAAKRNVQNIVEVMQALMKKEHIDEAMCYAAENDSIDVFKFLSKKYIGKKENRCLWLDESFIYAAGYGHERIIRYGLHTHLIHEDSWKTIKTLLTLNGYNHILKWFP